MLEKEFLWRGIKIFAASIYLKRVAEGVLPKKGRWDWWVVRTLDRDFIRFGGQNEIKSFPVQKYEDMRYGAHKY